MLLHKIQNNNIALTFGTIKKEGKYNTKKSFQVAQILPKMKSVNQQQLDEIFADEKFAKKVLDNDWYCEWQKAMKLKKPLPTTGFCYPAAEFFYHFVDCDTQPMTIRYTEKVINNKTGKKRNQTHYFLLKENGIIYDPTKSQYGKETPKYKNATKFGFLTEFPSKKACAIAVKLKVITEDIAKKIPEIFRGKRFLNLAFEKKLKLLDNLFKKV